MSNRSPKDIVREFGIHPKTVRRYRNKLFAPMVPARRGRHILVSSATKEYIKVLLVKGALKTAKDVHRMLMQLGRKKRQPLSTNNHRKQRLAWAKKYQNWSIQQWHQVVFSDETKINIWGSDGCRYYWTQPGDVLRPHHIDLSVKHGSGKSIMWGYNDPKHKSKSTMTWLQQNKVQYINDWPPNSPDLNPIQHVWHLLKLRLSLYERKARNIDELWERVDVEWNKLDKDVCRSYIDSMPDRIAAVIKSKGRFTRY
ncbi:hypothetical protein G6F33_013035 [Rhizopus arrhizus]|nr:hypothetical protein G6F33_013035 [Rhizopus arrhizus]